MADSTPKSYQTDPTLYLYTSLTSGSSHIITATSRLETILKANKIPFLALDVATDERARMLWGRRAGKRKLPGLVQMGLVVGDLEEVEEWNEYGELKEKLGPALGTPSTPIPSAPDTPSKSPTISSTQITTPSKAPISTEIPPRPPPSAADSPLTTAMRQAGFEAAKKAGDAKKANNAKLLAQAKGSEQSGVSSETLQKLDNSGLIGMPPPSGTTDASSAMASETGNSNAASRADAVPATTLKSTQATDGIRKLDLGGVKATKKQSDETTGAGTSKEEIGDLVNKTARPEESDAVEKEADNAGLKKAEQKIVKPATEEVKPGEAKSDIHSKDEASNTKDMAASNEAQDLPGKRTQDQPAASGKEAGASVAD